MTISYGDDIFEFEAELDGSHDKKKVRAAAWDPATQKIASGESPLVSRASGSVQLQHAGPLDDDELSAWAKGSAARHRLAKTRGRVKIHGTAEVLPGDVIELKGLGSEFSQNVFVSAVRLEVARGDWLTDIQFGLTPATLAQQFRLADTPGGIQIKLDEDKKELKIKDPNGNTVHLKSDSLKLEGQKNHITLDSQGITLARDRSRAVDLFDVEAFRKRSNLSGVTRRVQAILRTRFSEEDVRDQEFYVVEHLLLRRPYPNALAPDSVAPLQDDRFSFRVSIVTPDHGPIFGDQDVAAAVEQICRREMPAHLVVEFHRFGPDEMGSFKVVFADWMAMLASRNTAGQTQRLRLALGTASLEHLRRQVTLDAGGDARRMVTPELAANATDVQRELDWFSRVLDVRSKLYFGDETPHGDIFDIAPPQLSESSSPYAEFVREYELGFSARLALVLALTPHVSPRILDVFFTKNKTFDRPFTEFGGEVVGGAFLPTGQTLAFLLAAADLERRFAELRFLFDRQHIFRRAGVLQLDGASGQRGEPVLNGRLQMAREYVVKFTSGEPYRPDAHSDFPAHLITTALTWDDLVLPGETMKQIDELRRWVEHGDTLLQRVECYDGMAILASNMKSNIDAAFLRRFETLIHFPMPGPVQRLQLWQNGFSARSRLDEIDLKHLANQHELTGAAIMNVIRDSSLAALARGSDLITAEDLRYAIGKELHKQAAV